MTDQIWSLAALKAHFDALREADQRAVQIAREADARLVDELRRADREAAAAALIAVQQANAKDEGEVLRWREQSNEWRGAMTDRERTFISRREIMSALLAAVAVGGFILQVVR